MEVGEAAVRIDNQSYLLVSVAHTYAIFGAAGIDVVVSVPVANIVVVAVIEIEHTVLIDSFHHIAYAYVMVMTVGVLHDLNNDDGDDYEMVWFAVVYNGFVVDDTLHFGYLILVCSALLLFVVEFVLVQYYLDCSMVGTPVAVAVAFVDTTSMNFDYGSADTVLLYYSDDSVNMDCYFEDFVRTEVENYFDALIDKEPAIHLVDKVLMRYANDTVVPNN